MRKVNIRFYCAAILILEPYAFEVKKDAFEVQKVIVFITVISMGYASRNAIKNHL